MPVVLSHMEGGPWLCNFFSGLHYSQNDKLDGSPVLVTDCTLVLLRGLTLLRLRTGNLRGMIFFSPSQRTIVDPELEKNYVPRFKNRFAAAPPTHVNSTHVGLV